MQGPCLPACLTLSSMGYQLSVDASQQVNLNRHGPKNTHKGISGVFWDPRLLSSVNYMEEKRLGWFQLYTFRGNTGICMQTDYKKLNNESRRGPKRPQKCLLRLILQKGTSNHYWIISCFSRGYLHKTRTSRWSRYDCKDYGHIW